MDRRAFVAGLVVGGLAACVNIDGLRGGATPGPAQPEGGIDAGAEADLPLQPPDASLDPTLVGLWTFDEPNGPVAHDMSGNGNDATLQQAARIDPGVGLYGSGGLVLTADKDAAVVEKLKNAAFPRTGTLWMRFKYTFDPNDGLNHPLFDGHDPSRSHIFFRRPNGATGATTFQFALQATGGTVYRFVKQEPIPRNEWTTAAITWSEAASEAALFIKGTQMLRANYVDGPFVPTDQNVRFGDNFPGVIDEVRIYNRVVTGGELVDLE